MREPRNVTESDLTPLKLDKAALAARDRRRRRRWPLVAAAIVTLAVVAGVVLPRLGGRKIDVLTVPPPDRPIGEVQLTASGYVVARRKAAVGAKIPGRLAELRVEEGTRVRAGEVIARLEADDLEASVARAVAEWKAAAAESLSARTEQDELDREAKRRRTLFEEGIGPRSGWESAETAADAGRVRLEALADQEAAREAAVRYARAVLENSIVRAPFDGVVLTKDAEVGESVAPAVGGGGTTRGSMVTMADMGSLEVEADVSESNIADLGVGQGAEVILDAYPDRAYPAVLHQIVPTADRQKATVEVKVRFTGPPEDVLPEMSAKVLFLSAQAEPGHPRRVITLPESVVRKTGDRWVVLAVEEGTLRAIDVTLSAPPVEGTAEVVSGLTGGETVVVAPTDDLEPGERVRATPVGEGAP